MVRGKAGDAAAAAANRNGTRANGTRRGRGGVKGLRLALKKPPKVKSGPGRERKYKRAVGDRAFDLTTYQGRFGAHFRWLVRAFRLDAREISERFREAGCSVSAAAVGHWMCGNNYPTYEFLEVLGAVFGLEDYRMVLPPQREGARAWKALREKYTGDDKGAKRNGVHHEESQESQKESQKESGSRQGTRGRPRKNKLAGSRQARKTGTRGGRKPGRKPRVQAEVGAAEPAFGAGTNETRGQVRDQTGAQLGGLSQVEAGE